MFRLFLAAAFPAPSNETVHPSWHLLAWVQALHWQSQNLTLGFIKEAELRHTNTPTLSDDGTKLEMPQVSLLACCT